MRSREARRTAELKTMGIPFEKANSSDDEHPASSIWRCIMRSPLPTETHLNVPVFLTGGVPFQWGPELRADPVYSTSSWTYGAAGLPVIFLGPEGLRSMLPSWPWRLEGAALVLMSIVSYFADVASVDKVGLIHVCDRILATLLTSFFVVRLSLTWNQLDTVQCNMGVVGFIVSMAAFVRKRRASHADDLVSYRAWTVYWHASFPFFGLLWFFYTLAKVSSTEPDHLFKN